jgi:predicted peptidase
MPNFVAMYNPTITPAITPPVAITTFNNLGDSSKISKGDRITAIGYPAIVDGGTNTKKSKTVPTVTQGDVSGSTSDAGGHKLFSMSTQIAAGNSGGPAFDNNGKQVGLNTYGGSACANSGKSNNSCFGRGIFRDIADLKTMAKKNNVTLSANIRTIRPIRSFSPVVVLST